MHGVPVDVRFDDGGRGRRRRRGFLCQEGFKADCAFVFGVDIGLLEWCGEACDEGVARFFRRSAHSVRDLVFRVVVIVVEDIFGVMCMLLLICSVVCSVV